MSWDTVALLTKAQRFVEEMQKHNPDDWQCGFWSSLALEILARSALSKISPTLLADSSEWQNLYFSLGYPPNSTKFSPKSIGIAEVLNRLRAIVPTFTDEHRKFCTIHTGKRNEEVHSAETPFDGAKSSSWLPSFYGTCDVLMTSMGSSLEDLVGLAEGVVARALIAAAKDETAKAVMGQIHSYQIVWNAKDQDEQFKLAADAAVWAVRREGHVVHCPACNSKALIAGEPIASPKKSIDEDVITETVVCLPSKFECIACGIKISGLSHLTACGLGDTYNRTIVYDAADYYKPDDDDSWRYEEDNNEP